jgi:hypothetical protein
MNSKNLTRKYNFNNFSTAGGLHISFEGCIEILDKVSYRDEA